ncbi:FAD dependent oxidoreductase-domain-containing protein [Pyrenochaeta sp. MPI-SDFR-AT-0127]|nr:FAD dependent oxidoreductase-domain-containing protein [Pyrenochaeta sp. MPI-SDFR-AT-0127]
MSLIKNILAGKSVPKEARQAALDRIYQSPGVPKTKETTTSFWLREPHPSVAKVQSTTFPSSADIAILGSGITALSVAWTILQTSKEQATDPPSVVILEARDCCSGATGRNGGHLLETALEYLELKEAVGLEAARKITKFRLAHLTDIEALLLSRPELRLHCQFRQIQYVSVYFDNQSFQDALESLNAFRKDMPKESEEIFIYKNSDKNQEFQLSQHAVGAITGPAGAVWPYRFVTSLLDELQRDFPLSFRVETNTPVEEITRAMDPSSTKESHPYSISTPRGILHARQVVHCTNGYVSHLVPGFRGRVVPVRGQMSAQGAGQTFKNQAYKHSWVFNYKEGFDYLTQLPSTKEDLHSNGEMMLGGGLAASRGYGIEEIGVSSDNKIDLYVDIHLSGTLSAVFGRKHWGHSSGVKNMWTGIMGFSSDGYPWVGQLPPSFTGRRGEKDALAAEWAAVGFSGEGMVHAWLSGKAIGIMLLVQEQILPEQANTGMQEWLPDQFCITEARVLKSPLPRELSSL